uniref:GRAM domain-containing protein 1A-like n=1 Tax=Sinocyclocheilus anshuiensis TaxID=1608454 RepID=A0A671LY37_9TELE
MTKEKTAKLIPNAIQISTEHEKHFFTSFGARDRSYMMIFRLWQNALMDKTLSPKELWHIVHQCYGTELGLTSEDDDYVSPTCLYILPVSHSKLAQSACNTPKRKENLKLHHMTPLISQIKTERFETTLFFRVGKYVSNSYVLDKESRLISTGEVESFCADLSGRLHINTVVRMSVDKLYDLLFSDTHFIQHLFSQRHFTDLSVHEWQQDSSSGNSSRVLSYTIAINNPLGPKTAPVVETQTLHKSSTRGECSVVDSEVITSGIPYQDYFYTVHRYCLTSVNKHKSRLRVSSDICYRKQPWSLVKALIEKNTWSGIEEYYRHMEMEVCKLETLLQSEISVVSTGEVPSVDSAKTPPGLRRRKRNCPRRAGERERERDRAGGGGGDRGNRGIGDERERRAAGESLIAILKSLCSSFSLVVLVALNMMLFYKLWALERAAHTLETWHSPLPQTAGEWAQVLQLQRQFHQAQMNKWQQILQSSVTLLDQMKQSLERLHRGMITPEVQQESESEPETLTDQ